MARTIQIREPDDGYRASIKRSVAGPVATQALKEDFALRIIIGSLLDEMRWPQLERTRLAAGLFRQCKYIGPTGERGWAHTLEDVLDAYGQLWREAVAFGGLVTLCKLEGHGFQYETVEESLDCVQWVQTVLDWLPSDLLLDSKLQLIIDANQPPVSGIQDDRFTIFSLFIHFLAQAAGWNCKGTGKPVPVPLAQPWVLAAATLLGILRFDATLCGRCQKLHLEKIWTLVMKTQRNGMGSRHLELLLARAKPDWLCDAFGVMSQLDARGFEELGNLSPDLHVGRSLPDVLLALGDWKHLGHPGVFRHFLTEYGRADVYQERRAAEEAARREAERLAREEEDTRRADNAPKGRKRGQPGYVGKPAASVDFAALCSQLNVCAHVPGADETLARAIIVHGLLREGERVAAMDSLPARDEKKLWNQCRPHLNGSPSRREFKRTLQALHSARVVSFSGGTYRLATPSDRFPQAHALLTELRALVSRMVQ